MSLTKKGDSDMEHNSIKDLLLKLKTMSDRGERFEAEIARRKLDFLLDKYGLSMDDIIDPDEKKRYSFSYKYPAEKQILVQCIAHVLGDVKVKYYRPRGTKKYELKLTKFQYVQIEDCYSHYVRLWRSEVEVLLQAFIQTHGIVPPPNGSESNNLSYDELEKIRAMMNGIDDSNTWEKGRKIGT